MINTAELRLGNLVGINNPAHRPEDDGELAVVVSIAEGNVGLYLPAKEREFSQFPEYVAPLIITPEILEAFGFAWETDSKTHLTISLPKQGINKRRIDFYYKDGVCEMLQMYMEDYLDGYFQTLPPKYVHQLQNIYFDLAIEELTFKPTKP